MESTVHETLNHIVKMINEILNSGRKLDEYELEVLIETKKSVLKLLNNRDR